MGELVTDTHTHTILYRHGLSSEQLRKIKGRNLKFNTKFLKFEERQDELSWSLHVWNQTHKNIGKKADRINQAGMIRFSPCKYWHIYSWFLLWAECLVSPTPKFLCWSPNPQYDSIWRWNLWEVIRIRYDHEDEVPMMGLCFYKKRKKSEPSLSLSYDNTARWPPSTSREKSMFFVSAPQYMVFCCSSLSKDSSLLYSPMILWLVLYVNLFTTRFIGTLKL